MLEQLFGSRTRDKLLKLFLENYEQQFFVREITRAIGERIHSVRRELENLLNLGLLTSQQSNQKRFYKVNKDFLLFNELTALIVKSQSLSEKIVAEKVNKIEGIRYLALTGRLVGDQLAPIDILIVGKLNQETLLKLMKDLEKIYQKEIRYTYLTSREFNLRRALTDKFLYSILNGPKIVMINKL